MVQTNLDEFEEVKSPTKPIVKLEVGESITGVYGGAEMGKYGYLVKLTEDGIEKLVSANSIMWDKINRLRIGDVILITRLEDGFSEKRQEPYKDYAVYKKK